MILKELIKGVSSDLYLRFCRDNKGNHWGRELAQQLL